MAVNTTCNNLHSTRHSKLIDMAIFTLNTFYLKDKRARILQVVEGAMKPPHDLSTHCNEKTHNRILGNAKSHLIAQPGMIGVTETEQATQRGSDFTPQSPR